MKRRQLARDLREDVREQIRKLEVEVAELRGELRAMRAANANRLWRPETSATAAAASLVILSASRIVTRGIRTITGSPSSPFSVRVTSSLRQLTTLRMSEKPISLSSRTTCSTVTSARSAPARMKLEHADDLLDRHLGQFRPAPRLSVSPIHIA